MIKAAARRPGKVAPRSCALVAALAAAALPQLASTQTVPTVSLAPMVERVSSAVVNISVSGSVAVSNPLAEDELFRRFFQLPPEGRREIQSAGSGVIVDADQGYILTNHHVLENADKITVTLLDNRSLEARVIGSDEGSDLAVLQVDARNLTEMSFGDSAELRVGDYVVAIGNPFGLSHTVTAGIVSGLGRTGITGPDGYGDFIQTDASINPGNSGGALVNLEGDLIGINTAIFSRFGGNIGIGFAIPVNTARNVMEQLITTGSVSRGLLGVSINNVTSDLAETYGLAEAAGAIVMAVNPGSAAEQAGIRIDDVIVSVNGNRVRDAAALRNAIGMLRPGERVAVGLVRDGRQQTVNAVLGELAASTPAAAPAPAPAAPPALDPVLQGATIVDADPARPETRGVAGLLVTDVAPNSPAAQRGLQAGDVIVEVNRQSVRTVAEASRIMSDARTIILKVRRGGRDQLLLMR